MRFVEIRPPRRYTVGISNVEISDCGRIYLSGNEQVTFVTPTGREYDVASKSWGFYATPSVNSRLKNQGFKTALVRNSQQRNYVMLVEQERLDEFAEYLRAEKNEVIQWLDEL